MGHIGSRVETSEREEPGEVLKQHLAYQDVY